MAGGINILHRSVVMATAITIFLAMVGIAQSTQGASVITNELNTDLRFAVYSDTTGYKTQVRQRGEKLYITFELALSAFWNVSMLAPHEVPEKSKTIQIWSRVADPSNPTPLSQWNAREDGLYVYDSVTKGLVFAFPWDFA